MTGSDEYAFCVSNKKYAFNLKRLKEYCLTSDKDSSKEVEKIENFEMDDEMSMMKKVSTISREVKTAGNPQNDSIVYDLIKTFINVILDSDISSNGNIDDMNFSMAISFNTLLTEGIIYKIED